MLERPTPNFCGLLTFRGFLRSFSLYQPRSARLRHTMKPPGTKVSAALRSSRRRTREGRPRSCPAGRGAAVSRWPRPGATPPLLLPSRPGEPTERRTRRPRAVPPRPPRRASPGPASRRVGGAAGPRRRQDPRARTKECGEGARKSAGRRAAPVQAPPRALPGAGRGPRPPTPHPPRPQGRAGGRGAPGGTGAPLRSRSEGGATRAPGRSGARSSSSRVGRGLTPGAWSNISFLESNFNYLG